MPYALDLSLPYINQVFIVPIIIAPKSFPVKGNIVNIHDVVSGGLHESFVVVPSMVKGDSAKEMYVLKSLCWLWWKTFVKEKGLAACPEGLSVSRLVPFSSESSFCDIHSNPCISGILFFFFNHHKCRSVGKYFFFGLISSELLVISVSAKVSTGTVQKAYFKSIFTDKFWNAVL